MLVAVSCFILSCQDKLTSEKSNGLAEKSNLRLSSDVGEIELNYEVETTRRTETLTYGRSKAKAVDVIYNAPIVLRNTVHVKIMADGALESESVERRPSNEALTPKHKSLPDPDGRYFRRVTKSNTVEVFNEGGKLIG